MREFDLNIERVLENWTVAHALREVIANALDEQALTGTREPQIFRDAEGRWHIRDWGRGLRYEHLTQNENKEKLAHPDQVVGKFGVGLKDALATFDRHRVVVVVRSRYGDITTGKQAKHGFADIKTLHALITEPADPSFTGTEFIMHGDALGERQVEEAKALFLRYSGDEELGVTPFGTVLRRANARARARIYVNGLRVAEEDNFLFSYNITSPTTALRRALNRERSNVGRSAYTDRVKSILLACDQDDVIDALVADLQNYERGTQHDETQWLDVGLHACKQLNARRMVIFLTAFELCLRRRLRAASQGRRLRDHRGARDHPQEAPQPARRPRQPHTRPGPLPQRVARQLPLHLHRPRRPQRCRTSSLGDTAADFRGQRRKTPARDRRTRLRDHAPDGRPLPGSRGRLGTGRRLDHR